MRRGASRIEPTSDSSAGSTTRSTPTPTTSNSMADRMRLRLVLLAAALTAVAVPGGAGDWPGGGMHKGKFWRRDKVRDQLELTDDEIDKLENVVAHNRDSLE